MVTAGFYAGQVRVKMRYFTILTGMAAPTSIIGPIVKRIIL
jgi:hypothetical protein